MDGQSGSPLKPHLPLPNSGLWSRYLGPSMSFGSHRRPFTADAVHAQLASIYWLEYKASSRINKVSRISGVAGRICCPHRPGSVPIDSYEEIPIKFHSTICLGMPISACLLSSLGCQHKSLVRLLMNSVLCSSQSLDILLFSPWAKPAQIFGSLW